MKNIVLAATAVFAAAAPASAAITYNSAPAAGFFFGNGNNYTPANAAVNAIDANNEIALRFHRTFEVAPASTGNTYSFALGTTPISFDWSLTSASRSVLTSSLITVQNVGTGQTVSYNPFLPGNDNAVSGGTVQNSARLNFGFLLGNTGFTPNVDSLYRVTFATDFGGGIGAQSLSIDARIGAGVPEPTTWAMMIGGFGLIGGAMRRRTRTSVSFA